MLDSSDINMVPEFVSDEQRTGQKFDYHRFKDAVVMPWYRNQVRFLSNTLS